MSQRAEASKPRSGDRAGKDKTESPPEIRVKVSWCKGCGLCVDYCNRDVLEMDGVLPKVVHPEKCTRCMQCEAICPDFAIEVRDGEVQVASVESEDRP